MKMKNILILAGVVVAIGLAAMGVRAATGYNAPSTLGYSGTLLSGSSPAADGNYVLTFSLFGAATGGAALWTETQTSVSVIGGRFNVALGATTKLPSTVLDSKALWLEITVGSEVLSPRQQVTSAPYAMRAPLQCRTVTNSVTPTSTNCTNFTVSATCDSTEIVVGGACPSPFAGGLAPIASFASDDSGFTCTFSAGSPYGTGCNLGQQYSAQARCCKM